MKFLGDHLGQSIDVLAEEEFDEVDSDESAPYMEVGASDPGDGMTTEDYLKGFKG